MPILLNIISKPKDHHIYRLSKSEHFKSAYHLCVFNSKFPISILCVSGLVFIISFFGLSLMDYNASVLEDLRPGNSLYDNLNYVDEKLGGSLSLEVIIEKKDDLNCLNPDFIKKMQPGGPVIINFSKKLLKKVAKDNRYLPLKKLDNVLTKNFNTGEQLVLANVLKNNPNLIQNDLVDLKRLGDLANTDLEKSLPRFTKVDVETENGRVLANNMDISSLPTMMGVNGNNTVLNRNNINEIIDWLK